MSLEHLLLIALFAFVSEYVDSSLGMGYGTTLTPVLLLYGISPADAVPAVLLSEFVTGLVAARLHHSFGNVHFSKHSRDTKAALLLALCGLLGTTVAVITALRLPAAWISTYIGLMVFCMGLFVLFTRNKVLNFSWGRIASVGLVAAFNKGIGGGGYGTLVTGGQLLSGLDAGAAIGITSLAESIVSLSGVALYFAFRGTVAWELAAALAIGAVLACPLAAFTVKKIRSTRMRTAVGIGSCILGVLTLFRFASV